MITSARTYTTPRDTISRILARAAETVSMVRSAASRRKCLSLAKTCSIGFTPGLTRGWRIGRQEQQVCACLSDRGADGAALVRAEVVHHDEIAGLEGGDERLLDPGGEALAVDPSPWSLGPVAFPWLDIEKAWGLDAVAAQGGEEAQRAPVAMRVMAWQAIPARCPTAQGGHVRLHPGFVNEDQPLRVDPVLMPAPPLPPAGHVGPVNLAGQRAFF